MDFDFRDRVAIVTGAGNGIGRSYALHLAARGAKVVVNDPGVTVHGAGGNRSAADLVVAEIRARGGTAVANHDSVASSSGGQAIADSAMEAFGRLDVLVNNAGVLRDKSFAKMTIEDFEFVLGVHFLGSVYCTKAAWPFLLAQSYGRVVLTTSGSGLTGAFGQSNYGAAKTAMVGLMNCLKLEGERANVLVNCISPSAETRMTEGMREVSTCRFFKPEHVAAAVGWLASEACNVSGEIIAAAAGSYTAIRLYRSPGVDFPPDQPPSDESFAEALPRLFDFTNARPLDGFAKQVQRRLAQQEHDTNH